MSFERLLHTHSIAVFGGSAAQELIRQCDLMDYAGDKAMSKYLKVTRNGGILEIVLDRPKANAINGPLSQAMGEVFAEFHDDP